MITETIHDQEVWNNTLKTLPYSHVLQTWEWGEFKRETTGWLPTRLMFKEGGVTVAMASILTRRIGPVTMMYIPKGPALCYENLELARTVLHELKKRARFALWLKIDPDVVIGTGIPDTNDETTSPSGVAFRDLLQASGWQFSNDQVQFRNTIRIDLTKPEDDILMGMSQNTRRKIRTAEKKGIIIRPATLDDLETLYNLYQITGERDNFLIRPPQYYEKAWRDFIQQGLAHALIAEFENKPVAHVILFHFGQTCWYFYGASSNEERHRMPNYLLQWEAIKWAKSQGYQVYDMWGAPNQFDESDSMWGVYQFKQGFRGITIRTIGAWDYAPYPVLYRAYNTLRRVLHR
ncbi:MAG: peptidoglycan bridge formation glycyltransferase FemA/FemB family protein [Chloroflexi bacterium]|nr:MAG: peptidoglycan bridge formation glycyltransferase FemA/FemB family protein [Chloroflexota bacterium]